jgi:hypothetical protein
LWKHVLPIINAYFRGTFMYVQYGFLYLIQTPEQAKITVQSKKYWRKCTETASCLLPCQTYPKKFLWKYMHFQFSLHAIILSSSQRALLYYFPDKSGFFPTHCPLRRHYYSTVDEWNKFFFYSTWWMQKFPLRELTCKNWYVSLDTVRLLPTWSFGLLSRKAFGKVLSLCFPLF